MNDLTKPLRRSTTVSYKLTKKQRPKSNRGVLVVLDGDRPGRSCTVTGEVLLGRADAAHIHFQTQDVSRSHATIRELSPGKFLVRDLGSQNGTFVNGMKVDRAELEFGDRLRLGGQNIILFTNEDAIDERLGQQQRLEAVGRLASGVTHDFNNLLSSMMANLWFLEEQDPDLNIGDGDIQSALEDIRAAAKRAAQLTSSLRAFAGTYRRGEREVDVSQLLKEAIQIVRRTLGTGIELQTDITNDLCVLADAGQLSQTFMNLLINAREAMPDGGVIAIRTSVIDADETQPQVLVEIRDSGIGMDKETAARIFEPFYTTKQKGTGLGLATAFGIIRQHGGSMDVQSSPGKGATFRILLPLHTDRWGDTPTASAEYQVEPLKPRRILLVEPDELQARSTLRLLNQSGHTTTVVSNAEQALAQEGCFEVVLLQLENSGTASTCKQLRARHPDVRILVLSPSADEVLIESTLDVADGFIGKPFDRGELDNALRDFQTLI